MLDFLWETSLVFYSQCESDGAPPRLQEGYGPYRALLDTVEGLAHQRNPMSQGHSDGHVFNYMTKVFPIKENQRSFSVQIYKQAP